VQFPDIVPFSGFFTTDGADGADQTHVRFYPGFCSGRMMGLLL
jgi:hypothetical protein